MTLHVRSCPERRFASIAKGLEILWPLEPASSRQASAAPPTAPSLSGEAIILPKGTETRWAGSPQEGAGGSSQERGSRKRTLSAARRLPAIRAAQSDGVLLARDALGKALLPGVGVLLGLGAAAGHQAFAAEAPAASRPAPLPHASHPLALRAPEGRETEGRGGGGCWKPGNLETRRAEKQLLPLLPPIPPIPRPPQSSPTQPVALGAFFILNMFPHCPPGEWKHPRATRKEVWGAGSGLFKETEYSKRKLWYNSGLSLIASPISCVFVLCFKKPSTYIAKK